MNFRTIAQRLEAACPAAFGFTVKVDQVAFKSSGAPMELKERIVITLERPGFPNEILNVPADRVDATVARAEKLLQQWSTPKPAAAPAVTSEPAGMASDYVSKVNSADLSLPEIASDSAVADSVPAAEAPAASETPSDPTPTP